MIHRDFSMIRPFQTLKFFFAIIIVAPIFCKADIHRGYGSIESVQNKDLIFKTKAIEDNQIQFELCRYENELRCFDQKKKIFFIKQLQNRIQWFLENKSVIYQNNILKAGFEGLGFGLVAGGLYGGALNTFSNFAGESTAAANFAGESTAAANIARNVPSYKSMFDSIKETMLKFKLGIPRGAWIGGNASILASVYFEIDHLDSLYAAISVIKEIIESKGTAQVYFEGSLSIITSTLVTLNKETNLEYLDESTGHSF